MALVQRIRRAPRVIVRHNHAAAGDIEPIDDDEAARRHHLVDGGEGNWFLRSQREFGGFVAVYKGLGPRALHRLERGGVDHPFQLVDLAFGFLRRQPEPVFPARCEGPFAEPEDSGLEAGQRVRRRLLQRGDDPALDEHLVGERDADAFAGLGGVARRGIPALNGLHGAGFVAWREDQPVPDFDAATLDAAGQDAAVVEAIHVLNRESQRLVAGRLGGFEPVERRQHRRAFPPGQVLSWRGDIVTLPGRDGDDAARFEAELLEPRAVFGLHGAESLLRIAHQVHLVD